MAHTKQDTMRRALRREVAGTIGLLADEADFAEMRHYRSFAFDDHAVYLQQVEGLLKARDGQGRHTTLALFDPEEYEEFCADTGLDPDRSASRSRFAADLAATGATIAYDGRPLDALVPDLIEESLRQSTWEYTGSVLAGIGECADCGEDIGRAAFAAAARLLTRVLDTVGPGAHHLVCSASLPTHDLTAALHTATDPDGRIELDEQAAMEFASVLAVAIATTSPGGLVMRTSSPDHRDRVQGWRLQGELLQALTAAEVFDAYCTDTLSGEPLPPESGVDYCTAPDLGPFEGHPH
ncbi:hypothetical protein H9Y04_39140 [Streptomyces sp. TRM66268-LWL]|uniref:Uncharacterized protein n=1 Tax=Streptomyces polyasparticus TaxID=2767826 RepID=A0ABR7SUI9_9ACTN|nr:hypothetical protein [Streptomyces polyasparticus]MBC9718559.1 hypothetical protein [Streptomyces polyasparticus]